MKKLFVICLALALLVSMGCGNKPQNDENSNKPQEEIRKSAYLLDPVDGTELENFDEARYSYIYKSVEYRFDNEKNYEAFKKDPEKYLSK